jgi:hypothetical protein
MVEDVTLEECQLVEFSPKLTKEALERRLRPSTNLFVAPADPVFLPEMDVAQRLIALSSTGLADELTWASN